MRQALWQASIVVVGCEFDGFHAAKVLFGRMMVRQVDLCRLEVEGSGHQCHDWGEQAQRRNIVFLGQVREVFRPKYITQGVDNQAAHSLASSTVCSKSLVPETCVNK
jgi:hypothetical protein